MDVLKVLIIFVLANGLGFPEVISYSIGKVSLTMIGSNPCIKEKQRSWEIQLFV